ncbi:MAG TPA: hypothetical protein VLX29_08625 [Nitrospirota bacterium]|nr:hypothetical protein [Nitrospirota bacterium]
MRKKTGKDLTLKISQYIQGLLITSGFNVILSPMNDLFAALEQRARKLMRSKQTHIKYLAVKVNRTSKERLYSGAHYEVPTKRVTD